MATNPYDQFDQTAAPASNPYDQFDSGKPILPESPGGFIAGVKEAVGNIPSSAMDVGSNIIKGISHPINTAMGLWDIGAGALQAAFAPEAFKKSENPGLYSPEAEKAFNAAKDFYKQRYGSWDNFLNTVKKDPVGTAMDVSIAAGMVGKAARLAEAGRVASAAEKVAQVTDPVRAAGKVARGIARPAYQYTMGLTTGAGAEAIRNALKGGDAFTQAMRGKISETDVLDTAKGALQSIKEERGAVYRKRLAELAQNKSPVNISDIYQQADNWLKNYGITRTADGQLDFSKSTLRANPAAAAEVKSVYSAIRDFSTKKIPATAPGRIVSESGQPLIAGTPASVESVTLTPVELDTLKRVIQDSYASTRPSRAMVTDLANKVKAKIVREVPEYAEMTKDYARASDIIDDMNRGLSLSDKAATDTGLRKLLTAMREDKTFRRSLIDTLDKQAGTDVAGAVSGLLMKNPWSNRLGPIAHFYGTSAVAAYLHNPALLGLLPLASPRAVGEASKAIGASRGLLPYTTPLYKGGYVYGQLPPSVVYPDYTDAAGMSGPGMNATNK